VAEVGSISECHCDLQQVRRNKHGDIEIVAPDKSEMLRRRQAVLDRDLSYLVGELVGYIVSFCDASRFRPREDYRFTVEGSIYVRPDCVGHGVGKMLLAELISECQAKGRHSMVACICGVNASSVALHASLGFQQAANSENGCA
jgi:L-amino acid N-acyltransferase YncA